MCPPEYLPRDRLYSVKFPVVILSIYRLTQGYCLQLSDSCFLQHNFQLIIQINSALSSPGLMTAF